MSAVAGLRCRTASARAVAIAFAFAAANSSAAPSPAPPLQHEETNRQAFSLPYSELSMADLRAFVLGNRTFNLRWVAAPASAVEVDGLGPTFAQPSCSSCHLHDGRSRLPEASGAELTHAVVKLTPRQSSDRNWLEHRYGAELQSGAVAGVRSEGAVHVDWIDVAEHHLDGERVVLRRPHLRLAGQDGHALASRAKLDALVAPAVFGLGLVENIDEADLLAREDPNDRDGDGISGRAQRLVRGEKNVIGRFGWKAGAATLREQAAAAAWSDMGLTSLVHPVESCPKTQRTCRDAPRGGTPDLSERALAALETYLRLLAVPAARSESSPRAQQGRTVFRSMQCDGCHRESLRTGTDSPIALLNERVFSPYSDFLLHDLGEGLADSRQVGVAAPREWRTPPLWGLGLQRTVNGHLRLLHDGRAEGFTEAILWHDGEARRSRDRFVAARPEQRAALLDFLGSL